MSLPGRGPEPLKSAPAEESEVVKGLFLRAAEIRNSN
jgi:hypothetical protein